MLVDKNKRSLIGFFCSSTSICTLHHCHLNVKRLVKNHLWDVFNQPLGTPIAIDVRLPMDKQKKLTRDLLFSSTNMAAMTSRENLVFVWCLFGTTEVLRRRNTTYKNPQLVAQHCCVASFGRCFAFFTLHDQLDPQQKHLLRVEEMRRADWLIC